MGQGTQLLSAAEGDCTQPRCVLEDFPCAALLFDRHGNLLASNAKADDLHIGIEKGLCTFERFAPSVDACGDALSAGQVLQALLQDAACIQYQQYVNGASSPRWLLCQASTVQQPATGTELIMLLQLDITESQKKYDALKSSNDRMHEQMHALQRKLVNVVTENEAMRHVVDKLQCHVLGLRRQLHHAGLKPAVQLDEELLRPCPHKSIVSAMSAAMADGEGDGGGQDAPLNSGNAIDSNQTTASSLASRQQYTGSSPANRQQQMGADSTASVRLWAQHDAQLAKATADAAEYKAGFDKLLADAGVHKLQLDKAAADAAEYKAGYDKLLFDNAKQEAQLDKATADAVEFKAGFDKAAADAAEFKAGYDKLLVDSSEQKAQLDKAAADATEYKAGYDKLLVDSVVHEAQLNKAAADAVEFKAGYDKLLVDSSEQKAQLDKAAADAAEYKAGYDKVLADAVEQKAQFDKCAADAAEYKSGFDKLLVDNFEQKAQLDKAAADAAEFKAGYDKLMVDNAGQQAHLEKAAADTAEFKAGYDKLLVDSSEQKAQLDKAAADAAELKAGFDKLLVDTSEQKAQLDKAAADAAEYKAGFDKLLVDTSKQKAQLDKAAADAVEFKAGYDKLLVDSSEQKAQLDKAAADTAEYKAGFDKAAADAAEFKAGYDKLVVDTVEQKAQLDKAAADAVEFKAGYDKLLVDSSEQQAQLAKAAADASEYKAGFDKAAADAAEFKASYDKLLVDSSEQKAQLDKAAADAAEFKAGFDKAAADAAEFKAGYDKLLVGSSEQKAQLDKAAADAAEYKAGFDKLLVDSSEQQAQLHKAAADAAEYKAGYDKAIADSVEHRAQFDKLSADATELKAGYDKLAVDSSEQKAQLDKASADAAEYKAGFDKLLVDSSEQKAQLDKAAADAAEFKAGYDKLIVDSSEQKAQLDKASADANEYKAGYDKVLADSAEQKAQLDKAAADASEFKAGYDKLLVDSSEQKAQLDKAAADAAEYKAGYDKVSADAAEFKAGFDKVAADAAEYKAEAERRKNLADNALAQMNRMAEDMSQVQEQLVRERENYSALHDQHMQLRRQQEVLAAELMVALGSYKPKANIDAGTPADKLLQMLTDLLDGTLPNLQDILLIQSSILEARDIYQPWRLGKQLLETKDLEDQVGLSLVHLLGDTETLAKTQAPHPVTLQELCEQNKVSASVSPSTSSSDLGAAAADLGAMLLQIITARHVLDLGGPQRMRRGAQASPAGQRRRAPPARQGTPGSLEGHSREAAHAAQLLPQGSAELMQRLGGDPAVPPRADGRWRRRGHSLTGRRAAEMLHSAAGGSLEVGSAGSSSEEAAEELQQLSSDDDGGLENAAASICSSKLPSPSMPPIEHVEQVLATAHEWQWDAFALAEATSGHPLSTLAYFLFSKQGLIEHYQLKPVALARFLRRIEAGYRDNPYHNATHAADVLQTMHCIITRGGLMPGYVDPMHMMGCYTAAVVHDFEHGGLTNDFLVNSLDNLAVRYNDRSPLENHHLAAAFTLMRHPDLDFVGNVPKGEFDKFRKVVIELVLATDMKQHFSILSHFTTVHRLNAGGAMTPGTSTSDPMLALRQAPRSDNSTANSCSADQDKIILPLDENERVLGLQMALKCADVGHVTAALPVHIRWVDQLEEEFFRQGDVERAAGMTVSPLFDRSKQGITKSQVGFFDIVIIPLFHTFSKVFGNCKPLLTYVMRNYRYWADQAAAANKGSG